MREYLFKLGQNAKKTSINNLNSKKKNKVLKDYSNLILKNHLKIIAENQKDIKKAKKNRLKENLIKRLFLDKNKILNISNSITTIINFKDPVNQTLKKWKKHQKNPNFENQLTSSIYNLDQ